MSRNLYRRRKNNKGDHGLAGQRGRVGRPVKGVLRGRGRRVVDKVCVLGVVCKRYVVEEGADVCAKGKIFWKIVSARKGVG